ncbi:hypothetical protein B296_00033183 [Ensete ventricosum]|uniref:Uncharacterized protein n=1 Tax=Ensete ventricosum TaxID=4639 RepID=A0A426YX41_ENSVE|nr:hypothetical protein B296_00033183 [Ensete ventricosum]
MLPILGDGRRGRAAQTKTTVTCLANTARSSPVKEVAQLPWKEEGRALHPAAVSEAAMDARKGGELEMQEEE